MNDSRSSYVLQNKYGSGCADKDDPARHERFHIVLKGITESARYAVYLKQDFGTPIERHPKNIRIVVGSVMPQRSTHTRKGDLHALR
jgi:hypothetical protein